MHKESKINVYDIHFEEYELWFKEFNLIYESEINAIKKVLPKFEKAIEIGVGSARFAQKLGIKEGIEPSKNMSEIAEKRGVKVINKKIEDITIKEEYDLALMVTVDCFLDDINIAFKKVYELLKPNSYFVIAFIDINSPLGVVYESLKETSPFYRYANFNSSLDIKKRLNERRFFIEKEVQTVFELKNQMYKTIDGSGKGVFNVIRAKKGI